MFQEIVSVLDLLQDTMTTNNALSPLPSLAPCKFLDLALNHAAIN